MTADFERKLAEALGLVTFHSESSVTLRLVPMDGRDGWLDALPARIAKALNAVAEHAAGDSGLSEEQIREVFMERLGIEPEQGEARP